MSTEQRTRETVRVHAENIGGIDETELELPPGVTVLTGRNATNRTSFLQAIMAVLGSNQASLKGDASDGEVELSVGDATYTRTLSREGGEVVYGGDPYLDDSTVADLFAFLLESNEARQAVARSEDLHDIIMRPIDTASIDAEIDQLERRRRSLTEELEELEGMSERIETLKGRRGDLDEQIAEKKATLEEVEATIDDIDREVEAEREEQSELETHLEELREVRNEAESVRYRIETEQDSIASLEEELDTLEAEQADIDAPDVDIEQLEQRIEQLRERKQELDAEMSKLLSVIQFNEEMLDGIDAEIAAALRDDTAASVTDQLLDDDTVVCWTCGSAVDEEAIDETLDRLRSLRQEKFSEASALDEEIEETQTQLKAVNEHRDKQESLADRIERFTQERDDREATLESLRERRTELTETIEEMEETAESLEQGGDDTLLERHRRANELEFELERLESEYESVTEELSTLEDRHSGREELRAEREQLGEELSDLRTRIERLEHQAVEQFNDHMATVLDVLDYQNLDRIWLERREEDRRQGRRKVSQTVFELHVVRTSDEETAYEDTIDHLSESEREVTGLVFALAGYLVHDVHEQLPFVLLDSLEAIDSNRIATLIDYFAEYSDHLVVALLPEDAAALNDQYTRITEI
ncbi:archaea-specific SMC-related protein [Halomarina rubra]|uniref:Archaea-specific SMC-related protein n=1 Tax=Halomarina rubra TaxID=2071873 RepID=A0ABD6AQV6_9EURY|nr:archaea-specific SMC-related protein [Halomarina rubra]